MQTVRVNRKSFLKGLGAFFVGAFVFRRSDAKTVTQDEKTVAAQYKIESEKLARNVKTDSRVAPRKDNS